jgi:hypothetical protein
VWMEDPRRQQPKNDLRVADVDGVTGVMTALIARHDGKVRRQEVDDLALAFISPLRAKYGNVHRGTFYIVCVTAEDSKSEHAARTQRRK